MASVASRGVALIPLTITYGVDRSDVTIPQSVPLVELLPGLVESVGAFSDEPTNDGFAVRTASGRLLDQSKSLASQGVRAGAALTLEPLGEGASDMLYDDLTEAVGQVIERVSTPWTREDTRTLAALCAAALIFVAALLLATTPPDTIASLDKDALRTQNYLYGAIGLVSAMLVTGTSVVVARKSPGPSGIALAHTVPLLTAAAALRLTQSQWDKGGWISVGVGLLIGSLAALALPKRYRIQVSTSFVFVVALRSGGGLAAIFLTVSMLSAPAKGSVFLPLMLVLLGAVSLILQTRSIRARVEVLLGALTGLSAILVAAALATRTDATVLPWVTLLAVAAALVLVITNVVGPRMRPHLARLADTLSVLSLFVLIPLAVYLWG